jgi:hypothetical protein
MVLLLASVAIAALVGWFALQGWRTKSTIIAGLEYSRETSPRTYWIGTIGWTVAFVFILVLVIKIGLSQ